jgi:hypothetical protein
MMQTYVNAVVLDLDLSSIQVNTVFMNLCMLEEAFKLCILQE